MEKSSIQSLLIQIIIFISTTLNLSLKLQRNLSYCQKSTFCSTVFTLLKLKNLGWDSWSKIINCKLIPIQRWFTLCLINIKSSSHGWLKISFETHETSYTNKMNIWFQIKSKFRLKVWRYLMKLRLLMLLISFKLSTRNQSSDNLWSAWIQSLNRNWNLILIIMSFSNLGSKSLVRWSFRLIMKAAWFLIHKLSERIMDEYLSFQYFSKTIDR